MAFGGEGGDGFVQQDRDRFAGRVTGKGLIDKVLPVLDAQAADSGVRDGFGESGEFEVEGAVDVVGVAGRRGEELAG